MIDFSKIGVREQASLSNSIFIALNIDRVADVVIEKALDTLERLDVEGALFVTCDTSYLFKMRSNSKIELGIHPNLNPLLEGNTDTGADVKG